MDQKYAIEEMQIKITNLLLRAFFVLFRRSILYCGRGGHETPIDLLTLNTARNVFKGCVFNGKRQLF